MKRHVFYLSLLSTVFAMSASCGDNMVQQETAMPVADNMVATADSNNVALSHDELVVLMTIANSSPTISQDEAINIADQFFSRNSISKSTAGVKCDVVTRQQSSISKSGGQEIDTLMYVLNYGNDNGYALVCADIRVPEPILAFSETGSLDMDSDNPGLDIFKNMAENYMDANIAEIESKRDSLEESINEKLGNAMGMQNNSLGKRTLIYSQKYECTRSHSYSLAYRKGPLLHTYWGQGAPFNNYVPTYIDSTGAERHCPAGCVAIATSQLMAYWKWPNYIQGVNMQWNSLNFDDINMEREAMHNDPSYPNRVATLVSYVGESINTIYDRAGSGAWKSDAVNFLSQNGYATYGETDFNCSDVIQSIKDNRPLLISGYRTNGGHCWVLDGYVDERYTTTILYMWVATYREDNGSTTTYQEPLTNEYSTYSDYFHCNWGWNNNHDGYFLGSVFDISRRYGVSSDGTHMESHYSSDYADYYYQYSLSVAKNIHR